jgi:hypothetical protein
MLRKILFAMFFLLFITGNSQAAIVLDFEGLQDLEPVLEFYNGGTGGYGSSSGSNYGITFSPNSLASIDSDAGGTGNFGGEPSPDTAMAFMTGTAILSMEGGFDTGFSFSYSAINSPGTVAVYDGLNATGNILANIALPVTNSDGGDPNGDFSPFYNAGASFSGTARSIDFGGTVDQIGFDNITFNSATPGVDFDVPFLIGDPATDPDLSSRITISGIDGNLKTFDEELPTYIVSHGWQPDGDYNQQSMPQGQEAIITSIEERLGNDVDANIIAFEWEGAYTSGITSLEPTTGSQQAKQNADNAGSMLGNALEEILGEDYDEDLHFIGHSFGTIVNTKATQVLDHFGSLDSASDVQFTTLDSPTSAPPGYAINFNDNWFRNKLSDNVDYFDNYYGTGLLSAYGEPIDGTNLDQQVNYIHGDVGSVFYPDLIENGAGADTNPNGEDVGTYDHRFDDWITPTLLTWSGRPDQGAFSNTEAPYLGTVSTDYTSVLGTPVVVNSLSGYDNYTFTGLYLEEQSPVSVLYYLDIPLEADWLAFDWMVEDAGDGDWFTVHLGSELFLTMSISELIEGILFHELFDISDYAGMSKELYFTLNSVGDANASLYVGNLEYRGENPVPEPATMLLVCLGLLGLAGVNRRKK